MAAAQPTTRRMQKARMAVKIVVEDTVAVLIAGNELGGEGVPPLMLRGGGGFGI